MFPTFPMDKLIFYRRILLFASLFIEIKASFFFDYGGTSGLSNGNSYESHVSAFDNDRRGSVMDDRFDERSISASNPLDHISKDNNMEFEAVFNPKSGGRRRSRPGGQRLKYLQHFKENPDSALKRESLDEFASRRKKEMEEHPERFVTKKKRRYRKKNQKEEIKQSEEDPNEPKPTTEKAKFRFNTKLSDWYWKGDGDGLK